MTKYQFESVSIDEVVEKYTYQQPRGRTTRSTVALAAMLPYISVRSRYHLLDLLRDPSVHGAIFFTSSSSDHRGRIQLFGPGCSIATPEYATYTLGNLRLLWRKPCLPPPLPQHCSTCNFYGVALDFPTVLPPYYNSPVQMCPLCFAFLHRGPLSGPPKTPPSVSRNYLRDAATEGFSWPSVRMTAMQDRMSWPAILKF